MFIILCLLANPASAQTYLPQRQSIQPVEMLPNASDRMYAFFLLSQNLEHMMSEDTCNQMVEQFPILLKATAEVAVELEILDNEEVRYYFVKSGEFNRDLRIVNKRYHDLKDAPKVADVHRIPPREVLADMIVFNRNYDKYLDDYIRWNEDRAELASFIKKENQMLYQVYDLLRYAKCDSYHIHLRRAAMLKLKKLLNENAFLRNMPGGEDFNYETMSLPPNVPVWRFIEEK